MEDIIFDTNILSDLIAVYYECDVNRGNAFIEKYNLHSESIKKINRIINDYSNNGYSEKGILVASTFAFIEIARKFNDISKKRFSIEQFRAFISSPPEWFVIETISNKLFEFYKNIPPSVNINKSLKPIELPDAIHVITTLSRGEKAILFTSDSRLKEIAILRDRTI